MRDSLTVEQMAQLPPSDLHAYLDAITDRGQVLNILMTLQHYADRDGYLCDDLIHFTNQYISERRLTT